MKDVKPAKDSAADTGKQLDLFLAKYDPEIEKLARAALKKLRALMPGAVQMIYDNYNGLAIGFCATEKSSEAVLSVALYPKWVTLFFLQGKGIPDPKKLLKGSGAAVRSIRLEDTSPLKNADVDALIALAIARSKSPFGPKENGKLILKSVSERQSPRRED
jgi:hypothetical protein